MAVQASSYYCSILTWCDQLLGQNLVGAGHLIALGFFENPSCDVSWCSQSPWISSIIIIILSSDPSIYSDTSVIPLLSNSKCLAPCKTASQWLKYQRSRIWVYSKCFIYTYTWILGQKWSSMIQQSLLSGIAPILSSQMTTLSQESTLIRDQARKSTFLLLTQLLFKEQNLA